MNYFQDEDNQFGIDWGGPVPHESTDDIVDVPETPIPLNAVDLEELHATISPLDPSVHYGVHLYERVLAFVSDKVV